MISTNKIALLTPAYNEADHLADFLDKLKKQGLYILIVNDGSTDRSLQIIKSKEVDFIDLKTNHGKGYALRAGFRQIMDRGFEWVVILDSDGQHLPEEIPLFIKKAEEGKWGIVNGNRLQRPLGMSLLRVLTNHFMSLLISCLAKQRIHDAQCGFKMISLKAFSKALRFNSPDNCSAAGIL